MTQPYRRLVRRWNKFPSRWPISFNQNGITCIYPLAPTLLIAAFAVVSVIAGPTGSVSPLDDYKGLARRSPYLAGALTVMLLALAGMPATAGFIGKLGVFTSAWGGGYEWLVVTGLVASVAGFFFYIRIMVLMYMQEPVLAEAPGADVAKPYVSPNVEVVLAIAIAITIFFGIYPTPLLDFLG